MSLALWGDPVVVGRAADAGAVQRALDRRRRAPARRRASLHDPAEDAAKLAAPRPPLEALLPAVPGLMPSIDALAARGVRFPHAWSAATWTRAGTLAMLAGERSSELGIDTTDVDPARRRRWRATTPRDPPLLPLLLRRSGVVTAAFVNNFFMAGYVPVGVDMGFERVTDHRYRTRDTDRDHARRARLARRARGRSVLPLRELQLAARAVRSAQGDARAACPPPPAGPRDRQVRAYMAEAAKDDAAIGELLGAARRARADGLDARRRHGRPRRDALDGARRRWAWSSIRQRFHHAVGNFEETTRIPIVMALPGVLDGGRAGDDRVRNTDIAPTVLELEGLEADPRMSGRSLLPLVRGTARGRAPRRS